MFASESRVVLEFRAGVGISACARIRIRIRTYGRLIANIFDRTHARVKKAALEFWINAAGRKLFG